MNSSDTKAQSSMWRALAAIYVIAVVFNLMWELAQAPLYIGMNDFRQSWRVCLLATLGDGLLLLLIFAVGWLLLRRRDWFVRPGVRGYALMLVTGLVIAVSIELAAVNVMGRWEYTKQMPLVPGLGVGLIPVAQMLMLPPLIFRVVTVWLERAKTRDAKRNV
ncbi:MAG: hypothetical protein AB7U82_14170 [Blastocatellales bacterium]